jgi:signal transduction histidine kinase
MRELHDTVKQGVHGTSLMIEAATLAERNGDSAAVRDLLGKALETSRETGRELSKPMDELRLLSGHAGDPAAFFGEKLRQFGERFGMETHEDLAASLSELSPEELRVAHRVFAEAAWNAAKHSGACNLRLQTRREAGVFVLALRDDGRGFDPTKADGGGYGLHSMRSRAEDAGAELRVSSAPGAGTVVELRFGG